MTRRIFFSCVVVGIAVLVSFPIIQPLFPEGIPVTFDGYNHMVRIAQFHQALLDGNIPPSWSSGLAYGWGSPLFLYNWTLPYWLAEPFLLLGMTVTESLKMVKGLSVIASFFTMFVLLKTLFSLWPSIAGATLYTWAVFRIYLLYTSGAIGMEVALIFWPLIFIPVLMARKASDGRIVLFGAVSIALVMVTHQVMFLMMLPLWVGFVVLSALQMNQGKRYVIFCFSFLFYGLLLSSFFWVPAFAEKSLINIDRTATNFRRDFIPMGVLLLQPGFLERTGEDWWKHVYAIGWPHVGASVAAIILAFFSWLYRYKRFRSRDIHSFRLFVLFSCFFLLGIFLITESSEVLWEYIPLLPSFIYPIRFQALVIFCSSVLVAYVLHQMKRPFWATLIVIAFTLLFNIRALPQNPERTHWPDAHYFYADSTGDMMGEYLPKWAQPERFFGPRRWDRYPAVRLAEGAATINGIVKKTTSVFFSTEVTTPAKFIINQHYFPGWTVKANDHDMPITVSPSGEMVIALPPGKQDVRAVFTYTPLRKLFVLISVLAAFVLLHKGGRAIYPSAFKK